MGKIPLTGGAYVARSVLASGQRCVNLYAEPNPEDSEFPFTYYPTAGLTKLADPPEPVISRGLFLSSQGGLYGVVGTGVYSISSTWVYTLLGRIADLTTPVSFSDNGLTGVLVDGTNSGYTIDLTTHAFAPIVDPNFFGGNKTDLLDGFLLFNKPGTNVFYSTLFSQITPFDPLYFAAKAGYPDPIVSLIVVHRELWLFGSLTTEVWSDVGAAQFPFQPIPGVFIQHGCAARYSVATWDLSVFFISQDKAGTPMVMEGISYNAVRISTFAIEYEFSKYPTISDAIGFIYQQQGHTFYQLTFPTADKTWTYDITTKLWHEKVSLDLNGHEHRTRANCGVFAFGVNLVADWQNGTLYKLDPENYTENGKPVLRRRIFPHIANDGKRVRYNRFAAQMEVGTAEGIMPLVTSDFNLDFNNDFGLDLANFPDFPFVSLRWSFTKGKTFGNAILQSLGATGEFLTQPQWRRLGLGRDVVFDLFWTVNAEVVLQGAWIDFEQSES